MGNKTKAVTKTNVKVIINMDIAINALSNTQIKNLHDIVRVLSIWDEKYKERTGD
jgi:hypothetical protein